MKGNELVVYNLYQEGYKIKDIKKLTNISLLKIFMYLTKKNVA